MSFLRYNEETEMVELDPRMKQDPVVKALYDSDTTEGKQNFQEYCTYTYHVYAKGHPMENLLPNERKRRVMKTYFADHKSNKFEKTKKVKAFIDLFIDLSYTSTERFWLSIKRDFEDLKAVVSEIPFKHTKKIQRVIKLDVSTDEEDQDIREVEVDVEIEVDNSDEKMKALQRAQTLIKLERDTREEVLKEKIEAKKSKTPKRLFEERNS